MSTLEIVGYDNIQFTKAQNVLRGMGLEQLSKKRKSEARAREIHSRAARGLHAVSFRNAQSA
jgi:hypothetical protein